MCAQVMVSDKHLIYFPLSSLSVAIIVAAIAGPQWLFTEEKLSKQQQNISFKPRGDENDYITKFTKSSLWILCTETKEAGE